MGNRLNTMNYHFHPDENPYDHIPLEFDPLYGFPEGARKRKEPKVSFAELESMKVPPEYRDFCVHKVMAYRLCRYEHAPFASKCRHLIHEHDLCRNEELKDRMKDYEREKRLMQRRKRILLKQQERKKLAVDGEAAQVS